MNDEFRTIHLSPDNWTWLKNERRIKRPHGDVETMDEAFTHIRSELEHQRLLKEAEK